MRAVALAAAVFCIGACARVEQRDIHQREELARAIQLPTVPTTFPPRDPSGVVVLVDTDGYVIDARIYRRRLTQAAALAEFADERAALEVLAGDEWRWEVGAEVESHVRVGLADAMAEAIEAMLVVERLGGPRYDERIELMVAASVEFEQFNDTYYTLARETLDVGLLVRGPSGGLGELARDYVWFDRPRHTPCRFLRLRQDRAHLELDIWAATGRDGVVRSGMLEREGEVELRGLAAAVGSLAVPA